MAELVQRYPTISWPSTPGCPTVRWPTTSPSSPRSTVRLRLTLSSSDGFLYESGDARTEFTIQSISKPFTYALALDQVGEQAVDAKIGGALRGGVQRDQRGRQDQDAEEPDDQRRAIASVALVPAAGPDERFAKIRDFYSACAGRPLEFDEDVYRSEKATGSRNRAIAYMLDSFGVLADDPDEVLTSTSGNARCG